MKVLKLYEKCKKHGQEGVIAANGFTAGGTYVESRFCVFCLVEEITDLQVRVALLETGK